MSAGASPVLSASLNSLRVDKAPKQFPPTHPHISLDRVVGPESLIKALGQSGGFLDGGGELHLV